MCTGFDFLYPLCTVLFVVLVVISILITIVVHLGLPWLWARLDRKPNRVGERKFKRHQTKLKAWRESGQSEDPPAIDWNLQKDFKVCDKARTIGWDLQKD